MKPLFRWVMSVLLALILFVNVKQAKGAALPAPVPQAQMSVSKGQSGSELQMSASYTFGEQVTFVAKLNTPAQIQSATIFIFDPIQSITYTLPVTFDANGVSEHRFDTKQNLLRPFTTLLWRYDITLTDGSTIQSPTQAIRYTDDRFTWKMLEANLLRVHWYNGDDAFGSAALNAGLAGLQKIQTMFPPDLSQPVDVYIYASENDLRGNLFPQQSWAAGHADSPAGVVMITVAPGADQNILMEQRIPHELMHVMFYRRVGAGYGNVPAWLREGVAMQAEVYQTPDYDAYLADALASDRLIPIKDLCASFSPQIDSAFLAYAESRSFTNYLYGLYGADGLLLLAKTYANGVGCEVGTERAFGVSFAKLNRDWITSLSNKNAWFDSVKGFLPYIGMLCLVLLVPLISIISAMRKKGNDDGNETYLK